MSTLIKFLQTYEKKEYDLKIKILEEEEKRRLKGKGLISSENLLKLKR